jgi:hypothetical protein
MEGILLALICAVHAQEENRCPRGTYFCAQSLA